MKILDALSSHAKERPHAVALSNRQVTIHYADLLTYVHQIAEKLRLANIKVLGIHMDNGPAWAITDLAAQLAGVTIVPLPAFFSARQLIHAIEDSGIEQVYTDMPDRITSLPVRKSLVKSASRLLAGTVYYEIHVPHPRRFRNLAGISKITYTSGTTGTPKGVCLSQDTQVNVALSLYNALGVQADNRHLAVMPLSTLLENIGGIYLPILAGASTYLLPASEVGLRGMTSFDAKCMIDIMHTHHISSIILTPQLLYALVKSIADGAPAPAGLRFIAVGGAPLSRSLLLQGQKFGLPIYEGYGLSECSSVIAVNTPDQHRPGSVGKPLPHIELRFEEDGEILVKGNLFKGYLHEHTALSPGEFWPTGDLGFLDDAGYLHITGRKKNIFITSYGRNVAPEWVESELTLQPAIMQAVIFGENRPWNSAVIVPGLINGRPADNTEIDRAIAAINESLPDYAQVRAWIPAYSPFSVLNDQLTGTGRPRRNVIWHHYHNRIAALYEQYNDTEALHGGILQ